MLLCLPRQGKLEELEAEILEVNGNSERLARSYNELVELQLVLEKAGSFFDQVGRHVAVGVWEGGRGWVQGRVAHGFQCFDESLGRQPLACRSGHLAAGSPPLPICCCCSVWGHD